MRRFIWEPAARADLRRVDRAAAMRILHALTRWGETGEGDVKALTDRAGLHRLRVGKWRIFLDFDTPEVVRIHGVDNRGRVRDIEVELKPGAPPSSPRIGR